MNMQVIWPMWLIAIVVTFGFFEGWALVHGQKTLSRWVWLTTKAWPPFPAIFGLVAGGLIVHFFWTNQGL
jgi:hypothetical protein